MELSAIKLETKRETRKSHGLVHFTWKAEEGKQKRCVILINSSISFSSICTQLRASGIAGSLRSLPKFLSKGIGALVIFEGGTKNIILPWLTFYGRKSSNFQGGKKTLKVLTLTQNGVILPFSKNGFPSKVFIEA